MAFNKVILEGRLTADPEVKQTSEGVEFCNFTLAVDRSHKNKNGERIADFIPVKAWRNSAKFVEQYFKKGDPMLLEGRLDVSKYVDNDGNNKVFTSVVADNISFTLNRPNNSNANTAPTIAEVTQEFREVEVNDDELPFF